MEILVLLANKTGLDVSDVTLGRSLICKRKNKAPCIEPLRNPRHVSLVPIQKNILSSQYLLKLFDMYLINKI